MHMEQNGKCWICECFVEDVRNDVPSRFFVIDHRYYYILIKHKASDYNNLT